MLHFYVPLAHKNLTQGAFYIKWPVCIVLGEAAVTKIHNAKS